jgi:hypothetical protein
MRRLVGGALSYGAAAIVGSLLTLVLTGMLPVRLAPDRASVNALAAPDALTPFRSAGLQASSPQPVTVDSPCYVPGVPLADALQFMAASPADRFCLMHFADLDSRDVAWDAFFARGWRVTVHGATLLVYLGSSAALAYRYEGILLTLP